MMVYPKATRQRPENKLDASLLEAWNPAYRSSPALSVLMQLCLSAFPVTRLGNRGRSGH